MSFLRRAAVSIAAALRRPAVLALVALLLCAIAAADGVRRKYPFVDDVPAGSADDWGDYKRHAIDILDHGLAMPHHPEEYSIPGGFLYNYFVAGVFAVAGRNATYVYIVQAALMALGALTFYVAARRFLSPEAGLLFFVLSSFALYSGVYRELTFRLLSENLAVLLIALSILTLLHAYEKDSVALYAITGILLGAVVLTRPHLQLIPYATAAIVLWYHRGSWRARGGRAVVLLGCGLLVVALLALRNYEVTGNFTTVSPKYGYGLLARPEWYGGTLGLLTALARRALYTIGILIGGLRLEGNDVVLNKQLLAGSIGAVAQVVRSLMLRRLELIDAIAIAWVLCSHATFIAIPALGGYGQRFQWLVAPMLFLLTCRFLDALVTRPASSPVPAG